MRIDKEKLKARREKRIRARERARKIVETEHYAFSGFIARGACFSEKDYELIVKGQYSIEPLKVLTGQQVFNATKEG